MPVPKFEELSGGFSITFYKETKPSEGLPETVEEILTSMIKNPRITVKQLTEITGLSRRGVEWNIAKLKDKGVIQRIGPTKGGYWQVVKQ